MLFKYFSFGRKGAEEAMLGRTAINADTKAYSEFLARLDAPPQANVRLQRTMRTRAPWEEE